MKNKESESSDRSYIQLLADIGCIMSVKNAERRASSFTDHVNCGLYVLPPDLSIEEIQDLGSQVLVFAAEANVVFDYSNASVLKCNIAPWVQEVLYMGYGSNHVNAFARALVPGIGPEHAKMYFARVFKNHFSRLKEMIAERSLDWIEQQQLLHMTSPESLADLTYLHNVLWGLTSSKDQRHFTANLEEVTRLRKLHLENRKIELPPQAMFVIRPPVAVV